MAKSIYQSQYSGKEIDENIKKIESLEANINTSDEMEKLKTLKLQGKIYKIAEEFEYTILDGGDANS